MTLSVIIVNYNVKYYLEQCLYSIYRSVGNISLEVIVIDNASGDGSPEYISARFPHILYIYNEKNSGFSSAVNQGIRLSRGEYILLLNPDTVLAEQTLPDVLSFMNDRPQAGACGVKMITSDGTFLPESKRGVPSPFSSFWKLIGIQNLFPASRYFGGYYLSHLNEDSFHEVDVLAGAFMMLRRSVLEKTGLLDEDYFMFGEDIDLSCRVLRSGYKNYYLPFPILHYKGESTRKNSYQYVRVFYGAMDIFFKKHSSKYNALYRWIVRLGIRLRMYLAMIPVSVKKITGNRLALTKEEEKLSFLVFASERNIGYIRSICHRNKLKGRHHYVVAHESSSPQGHVLPFIDRNDFTHVVYDVDAFSFSTIFHLMAAGNSQKIQLGLYSAQSKVLVTSQKCYI